MNKSLRPAPAPVAPAAEMVVLAAVYEPVQKHTGVAWSSGNFLHNDCEYNSE